MEAASMLNEASAFGTIVQLLGMFKSEPGGAGKQTIDEYLEWLRRHNHNELVSIVETNKELTSSLQDLLASETGELKQSLERIESVILSIANSIPALRQVAASVPHAELLSKQCIDLLKAMEAAGSSRLTETKFASGKRWLIKKEQEFAPSERGFMEDDVATLVDLGLLRTDSVSKHFTTYVITRAGSAVVSQS